MTLLRTLPGIALLAAALFVSSPLSAKNMHGKFGVGYQRSLLGVNGFSIGYWMTPKVAFLTTLGAGFARQPLNRLVEEADGQTVERTEETWNTHVLAGAGLKYVLYGTKFANFSVGALFALGYANKLVYDVSTAYTDVTGDEQWTTIQKTESNRLQWGVEMPLEVEFFFADAFSINLATGMFLTLVPEAPADYQGGEAAILKPTGLGAVSGADEVGVAIGAGGLFGHAGFTFYF